jgi:hypothetical protein
MPNNSTWRWSSKSGLELTWKVICWIYNKFHRKERYKDMGYQRRQSMPSQRWKWNEKANISGNMSNPIRLYFLYPRRCLPLQDFNNFYRPINSKAEYMH